MGAATVRIDSVCKKAGLSILKTCVKKANLGNQNLKS